MTRDRAIRATRIKAMHRRVDEILRERKRTLFDAIAHGDQKHRAWLKRAIEQHFAGEKVDKPI